MADLSKIINTVLTNANVSLDEFALKISEYIKAESVQTQEIMQQIFNEVSKILEDNRRLTIGEIVGDSSSISEDLASLTIGDIMDLITELKESFSPQNVTLGDIDRLLLDNVIKDFIKNYNVNGILDLTLEDCMSILSLNATNSALEVLDSVLLLDFVDLISKLANEQIPPQV